jgi:hypothetical protein
MGSYSSLSIAGYEVDWSKSYIKPFWARLFTEKDKRSRNVPYDEYYSRPINDTDLGPTFEYAASAQAIKLRLEILGYSLESTKLVFTKGIKNLIKEQEQYNFDNDTELKHLKTLDEGGFYFWVSLLKKILDRDEIATSDEKPVADRDIYSFIIGDGQIEDTVLGYPHISTGDLIRGILEAVDDDDEVLLDMTHLVIAGYYSEQEKVCENAVQARVNNTLEFQKIIILTEGSSDSKILSKSLEILYPEVADYFSFMDFGATRSEGGSSALERTVKSFAAAGINNKVLALFDNDAAGVAAQRRLSKVKWPNNIRILRLPDLPLGMNYPTVGAQGATLENINGRACSIELYLGEEILKEGDEFISVHWRNLEDQINEYQGEIFQKNSIQEEFFIKLAKSQTEDLQKDWSGLRLIFKELFTIAGKIV